MSTPSPSSPPSLPPRTTRPSPFSLLPTELLRTIIESAAPLHYHTETYKFRQSTLRSLCLVSKLFYQIAKPLLFAVVYLSSKASWDVVLNREDLRPLVRDIVIAYGSPDEFVPRIFSDCIEDFQALRTFIVSSARTEIDLSRVCLLPNLANLSLCDVTVLASAPFCLRQIRELSLFQVVIRGELSELVNSTSFPSLRTFACYQDAEPLSGVRGTLKSLLPQLELVSLGYEIARNLDSDLLRVLNPITLYDIEENYGAELTPVGYLRLCANDSWMDELGQFTEVLRRTGSARLPSALYLPPPCPFGEAIDPEATLVYQKLEDVCQQRVVEIVYEKEPVVWWLNSSLSAHFAARVQEARRKQSER